MKLQKSLFFALALFLAVGTISSCKKKQSTDPGTAHVRLVNTVPSINGQDLYQENVRRTSSAVEYDHYSDFFNVVAGYSTFWTKDEISQKGTAITDALLADGKQYTLFIYKNKASEIALAGYVNDGKKSSTNKYRVRFLNICSDFNDVPLDVTDRNGDGVSTGLNFGDIPVYIELPLTTELRVHLRDKGDITSIPPGTFQDGKTYLIWFDTSDSKHINYHIIPED